MTLTKAEMVFAWLASVGCGLLAWGLAREFRYHHRIIAGAALLVALGYFVSRRALAAVMLLCLLLIVSLLISLLLIAGGASEYGIPAAAISVAFAVVLGRAVLRELRWWSA